MGRLIDLSHPLEHGQPSFPQDTELSITVHHTVESIGYNISAIKMSSHQGTHLDAPYHFFDDGKTIDQMTLDGSVENFPLLAKPLVCLHSYRVYGNDE